MITIVVRSVDTFPEEQSLTVHKKLRCEKWIFFSAAFNSQFLEGRTQCMTLQDVDIEILDMLLGWIYTGELLNQRKPPPTTLQTAKVWVLGQRFMMPVL
jgi:hypothetical protein